MKQTRLIPIIIVAIMLINCIMPLVTVFANTGNSIQLNSELYAAVKEELTENGITANYNDKQRKITISQEELAKVTFLNLSNSEISDVSGLEKFTSLVDLDLSSNELTKDSNLGVLSSLNLRKLDLSTNRIEDVSEITNLDSISEVNLHSQNFSEVHIISPEDINTEGETNLGELPEILSRAGKIKTEWVTVKNDYAGNSPLLGFDFSRFYNENKIGISAGYYNNEGEYVANTGLLRLDINITDTTNILSESNISIYYLVLAEDERAGLFKDANLYNVIKKQLTHGTNNFNSDLRTYIDGENGETLYEQAYDDALILVFDLNTLINEIPTLIVSNAQVRDLSGIETFIGLKDGLDVSYNYIDSIEKIVELQKNKDAEEAKLQERFTEQIMKLDSVRAEFMEYYTRIEEFDAQIKAANDAIINSEEYIKNLNEKLNDSTLTKEEEESIKELIKEKTNELKELRKEKRCEIEGYVNEEGIQVPGLNQKRAEAVAKANEILPNIYPELEKLNTIYKDDYKALSLLPYNVDDILYQEDLLVAMNEKILKFESNDMLSDIDTELLTGYLTLAGVKIEYKDIDGNEIENPISTAISKTLEKQEGIYKVIQAILEVDSIIQSINYLVLNYSNTDLEDYEYEDLLNKEIENILEEKENGVSSYGYAGIYYEDSSEYSEELERLQEEYTTIVETIENMEEPEYPDFPEEPTTQLPEEPTVLAEPIAPETEDTEALEKYEEELTAYEASVAAKEEWDELKAAYDAEWEAYQEEYTALYDEYMDAMNAYIDSYTQYEERLNELYVEIAEEITLNNRKLYIIREFKRIKEYISVMNEIDVSEELVDSIEAYNRTFSYLISASGKFVSLTEEEIKEYVSLPDLEKINITNNVIESLEGIEELVVLKEIYAGENEIADVSNVKWETMTNLKVLDLHFNFISNVQSLESIKSLTDLDVSNNLLSGRFEFNLLGLPNIKTVNFSYNKYTDIEELINQYEWIAKNDELTVAEYLAKDGSIEVMFYGQELSVDAGSFIVKDEESLIQTIQLPPIIKQLEELDPTRTVYGTQSIYGKVRNDGTVGLIISNEEGYHNGLVTVSTKSDSNGLSMGHGTICTIDYRVMKSRVDDVDFNENATTEIELGKTMQFNASVEGVNVEDTSITWKIEKLDENGNVVTTETTTNIDENGLLTVDSNETAKTIRVTATSNYDTDKFATIDVKVVKLKTTVEINENIAQLEQTKQIEYTANVTTEAEEKDVVWDIEGETSENTKFENNVLTIGEDEVPGTILTIKATSKYDENVSDTTTLEVIKLRQNVTIILTEDDTTAKAYPDSTKLYTAVVTDENGTAILGLDLKWSVTGGKDSTIENGLLTIGKDEVEGTELNIAVALETNDNYNAATSNVIVTTVEANKVTVNKPTKDNVVLEQTPGTTVSGFISGLVDASHTVKVLDAEGIEVNTAATLATGMKVIIDNKTEYTIVVTGDVNSDGKANSLDSDMIKASRLGSLSLTDVQKQAADINADGKINRIDSFILLLYRAGSKDVINFTTETIENIMK